MPLRFSKDRGDQASRTSVAGGAPMVGPTQAAIESSLRVDLSGVRVHTDSRAQRAARDFSARAFTYGNQIFLGTGERPSDLGLMAHESAHVVQQQGAPALQRLAWPPFFAGRRSQSASAASAPFENEAFRASAAVLSGQPFVVQQRTGLGVQRWGLGDILDKIADKANMIPGFRMFTIILGVNPVNMSTVDRSAANILRALVEFMPGGGLITQALENSGIFDKVGNWIEGQVKTLGMVGSAIKQALSDFLGSLDFSDIFDLGGVWDRAKRIFTEPIDKLISFAANLVGDIINFIKDAILLPLAKLAEGTRGWDLLTAVLGKNPITGEAVPRTAETLIPGFLKLIGQEEVWENMQKARALPRAWAWFQGALSGLLGFVSQIPTLAINAFKSLELVDIVLLPRAFIKVGAVFANFLGDFIGWAGKTVWNLLEIIFDVLSPGAFSYVKKTGAALKSILKNPLPFIGNLVKAAKLGFQNFASNFFTHLKAGLLDWLTGSLPGVYIPQSFSLVEIGKFVLSILGISWAQIRGKIVKALGPNGETIMKGLETAFDVIVALVRGGPAAAWEVIKDKLTNLKDMVIGGITDFVIDIVVKKAIPKLIAMFIPGAGFISAILSIYDTIMVFVQKIAKIIQVVTAFIDSIVAIAGGAIGAAAARVESILAGLLSLAINFLAGFVGLGKVADKIMGVIGKVRASVDKALDTAIAWIVGKAKALFARLFGKERKQQLEEGSPEYKAAVAAGLQALATGTKEALKKEQIDKKAAEGVAAQVIQAHRVFKSIRVVDAKANWDFEYEASLPKKYAGAHKQNGQLKVVKVKVKDPNLGGLLARAAAAVEKRGAKWAAAAKKLVDRIMLRKISARVDAPIAPRDQFNKQASAQYEARLNYEKTLTSEEPFMNIPDATAEVLTQPGTKKALARVITFEFTVVEDFFATDAEGKADKFAFHKIDQYFKTVANLLNKYGPDIPIEYYFIAPREPTDDTKDYIAGVLRELGATNIRVVWVVAG